MTELRSISIFVPALNEELNIESAVRDIQRVVSAKFLDWEILIFNDGSKDRTGEIAERLANENDRIRVFHHEVPHNIGGSYREAVEVASKDYFTLFPGDNENDARDMEDIFDLAGTADMIIPFPINPGVRSKTRQILSRMFVNLINVMGGLKLRYYNGTVLHRTSLLKTCLIQTSGFGYQAEIIIQLLNRGCSYRQVGIRIRKRSGRTSSAFRLGNLKEVAFFLVRLLRQRKSPRKILSPLAS